MNQPDRDGDRKEPLSFDHFLRDFDRNYYDPWLHSLIWGYAAAFALGFVGTMLAEPLRGGYTCLPRSIIGWLYSTVQIFTFNNAGLPGPASNWALCLARMLAPILALPAVSLVAVRLLQRKWPQRHMRSLSGHAIVVGLGPKGRALCDDLLIRKRKGELSDIIVLDIENHHNFAWKESHFGEEVVVHRKGATPAGAGAIGIIPGSMATPGYVVRGRGVPESMNSASHGAGRSMSRTATRSAYTWSDGRKFLAEHDVVLISAGLDEVPMGYKDIDAVMAAQSDLVEVVARFDPKLVKMAPEGERPED